MRNIDQRTLTRSGADDQRHQYSRDVASRSAGRELRIGRQRFGRVYIERIERTGSAEANMGSWKSNDAVAEDWAVVGSTLEASVDRAAIVSAAIASLWAK